MSNVFARPYGLNTSISTHVRVALIFGLFVFLFLFIFRPFKIDTYSGSLLLFTLGYGAVTTILMLLLNVLSKYVLVSFFSEECWTVGKEIFWTCLNLFVIAIGNMVYTALLGSMHFSAASFFSILLYTLAVGLLPIGGGILLNEGRLRHKYSEESDRINDELAAMHLQHQVVPNVDVPVTIPSENQGESFTVHPNNLLLMKAAENYTEVFWIHGGTTKRTVVRANLKMMEDTLLDHPQFNRCHKSYMANLAKVHRLSGNAQGYKLHFAEVSEVVPVSRKLNSAIKELLESYA